MNDSDRKRDWIGLLGPTAAIVAAILVSTVTIIITVNNHIIALYGIVGERVTEAEYATFKDEYAAFKNYAQDRLSSLEEAVQDAGRDIEYLKGRLGPP